MLDNLELVARFVAALFEATRGRPGRFQRICDCAERPGIKPFSVGPAVRTAEAAGLPVVHIDQPMVMLTAKGIEVARPVPPARVLFGKSRGRWRPNF